VAGIGYNGAPPGVEIDWGNRDEKNFRVIHSETNALKYCKPGTVYLLACTHSPCSRCLSAIAGYGIKKIIFEQWYHRDRNVEELCKEFGVELKQLTIS
jgi:deoxycytidylate deaminase